MYGGHGEEISKVIHYVQQTLDFISYHSKILAIESGVNRQEINEDCGKPGIRIQGVLTTEGILKLMGWSEDRQTEGQNTRDKTGRSLHLCGKEAE